MHFQFQFKLKRKKKKKHHNETINLSTAQWERCIQIQCPVSCSKIHFYKKKPKSKKIYELPKSTAMNTIHLV